MNGEARLHRLRWMCRRGMKELDVLLESFLSRNEDRLRAGEWPELESFLGTEDDRLWDWLRGAGAPADETFAELAKTIGDVRGSGA